MTTKRVAAGTLIWVTLQCCANAATIEFAVTPQFITDHPKTFSVTATKRQNGLIFIDVVRQRTARASYRVVDLQLRAKSVVIAQVHSSAFASEDSQTYSVELLPEYLAESQLTISESAFGVSGGDKIPLPGGAIYVIKFKDFPVP